MSASLDDATSPDLVSELEKKYFWWKPVGSQPRSALRVVAQAMDLASFADIRRLETVLGPARLVDVMLRAQPGWLSERSWALWRGRLARATGHAIPEAPPKRALDAAAL